MTYKVSINNELQTVHEARVSAFPFNQVWQGQQRPLNQTEIAYFVTFDITGTAKLDIEIEDASPEKVEIRPFEYDIAYELHDNKTELEVDKPCQFTVEVNGKHQALHVFANTPLDYCRSGKDIYFGPGEHHPGIISPQSGQTIYIDKDAVVYGVIYAHKVNNVHIKGHGILDCSTISRQKESDSEDDFAYHCGIVAYNCSNLMIEGIILRDTPFWALIIRNNCQNVMIDNIKIIGQWRYNSDGIDIYASQTVTVRNSFIRSFDDCIVARGAYLKGEDSDLYQVLVENCVMWCDWGKSIEVWAGHLPGRIHNINFNNNYLIHLSALAIDVTTWFGNKHTHISNIEFKNIFINTDNDYESLKIQYSDDDSYISESDFVPQMLRIDCGKLGEYVGTQTPGSYDKAQYDIRYENIVLENIICSGSGKKLSILIDSVRNPVEIDNVKLCNVDTEKISLLGKIKNFTVVQ